MRTRVFLVALGVLMLAVGCSQDRHDQSGQDQRSVLKAARGCSDSTKQSACIKDVAEALAPTGWKPGKPQMDIQQAPDGDITIYRFVDSDLGKCEQLGFTYTPQAPVARSQAYSYQVVITPPPGRTCG
jgi:hypothetical protein